MPDGVPPAVLRSFAAIVPAFVILTVVAGIQLAVKLAGTSVHEFIFNTIQSPLQSLAGHYQVQLSLYSLFIFFGSSVYMVQISLVVLLSRYTYQH